MPNIRFFYDNSIWDTATLAASTEATNYPAENTQDRWKRRAWRSTACTSEYIRTTGGAAPVDTQGFFVFYHNVTSSGTVTVKGSNNNWAASTTIGTMTRTADLLVLIPTTTQSYNDYGIFIADATNPAGYVYMGRVWIGEYWEPDYGYSPKVVESIMDPSLKMESTYGSVSILEKEKYDAWQMPFDSLKKADFDTFYNAVGVSQAFVILKKAKGSTAIDYPNPELYSYYVRLISAVETPFAGALIRVTMKIEEER